MNKFLKYDNINLTLKKKYRISVSGLSLSELNCRLHVVLYFFLITFLSTLCSADVKYSFSRIFSSLYSISSVLYHLISYDITKDVGVLFQWILFPAFWKLFKLSLTGNY